MYFALGVSQPLMPAYSHYLGYTLTMTYATIPLVQNDRNRFLHGTMNGLHETWNSLHGMLNGLYGTLST